MSSGGLQKRGVRVLAAIVIVAAGIFFAQKESAEEKEWWWRYAGLEAQGEHLDLEAFVPPEIPDDQNFFKAPGMEEWFTLRSEVPRNVPAGVEVFHVPDWLRRKGMNLENLMRMRNARQESSASEPESFEDLILWKKRTEAGIAMLRQASTRPRARLDADYGIPLKRDRVDLANAWNVCGGLLLRARMAMVDGDSGSALECMNLCRRIADAAGSDSSFSAGAVRASVLEKIGDLLEEIIRARLFGADDHLVAFQNCIRTESLIDAAARGLRIERAGTIHYYWRSAHGEEELGLAVRPFFEGWMSSRSRKLEASWERVRDAIKVRSKSWRAANSIVVVDIYQEVLGLLGDEESGFNASAFEELDARTRKRLATPAENEELAALVIPNFFPGMLRNTFSQQTKLTQLMVACALERHRLVSGVLPEELDELVPHYIEEVPIDVFSGQGLHYLRDGDGYVIWAVGWDGENDGGRPVAEKDGARGYDSGEGDWVWRYDPPE